MKIIKRLRVLVHIWLPAIATLYFVGSLIWDLPGTESLLGMLAIATLFFGCILNLGEKTYYSYDGNFDGRVVIRLKEDGTKSYMLELKTPPEDMDEREYLTFSVGTVIAD